ncbi:MAG: hypothetical protein GEV11_28885 [Streptosporangiales bacterium]|nr:hypothetical protein [Streptosporangiales bacterium]
MGVLAGHGVPAGFDEVVGCCFVRTFGPVTVALKRTENAMITDRPDLVLRLAARIPSSARRPTSNNRNRHLLDVADAHAKTRDYAQAIDVLTGIHQTSPEWLPNQRYAKDIMDRIVQRRRSLTPEMRTLAIAVRLPM